MSRTTWGILLIVVAFGLLAFIAYKNNAKRTVPVVFSPSEELQSLWLQYKEQYLETNTYRVLDKQKDNITTSEGESYALLRSVWLDDKDTFDKSWTWSKDNIQRQDNHLLSWLFGKRPDGTYGILTNQGGENTASDADTDTALALIFAAARWNQQSYYGDAIVMIRSIWDNEVVTINGVPYMTADNVEKNTSSNVVAIDPSYLSPYAYRIFAKLDPDHPWMKLVDSSYDIIQKSMEAPLNTGTSANIPPDWIYMNKKTGELLPPTGQNQTTDMGFDAMRVPFRLALDWQWFGDPRDKQVLSEMSFLDNQWKENHLLYTTYSHSGEPTSNAQTAAFYGGTIGYFLLNDPASAKDIYENKLQYLFTPDSNTWKVNLGYYDSNWGWFGIGLYNNLLPNLTATSTIPTHS